MEYYQKIHITENLASLVNLTDINERLLQILQSEGVLNLFEVEIVESRPSNQEKAKNFYEILQLKKNAFYSLINALTQTQQNDARNILLIVPTNRIENMRVKFLQETYKLQMLLSSEKILAVQNWLLLNTSYEQINTVHEALLQPENVLPLLRNTVPDQPTQYFPRKVTRALTIDAEIFTIKCIDVFVFRKLERSLLRKFVTMNAIEGSVTQLLKKRITARFIILDSDTDWFKLCRKIKKPVHLLRYVTSTKRFTLEETTGGSQILCQYLLSNNKQDEEMEEEQIVARILDGSLKRFGICDYPGMGKSLLFGNLARRVAQKFENKIVAYIQLSEFAINENSVEDWRLSILKHICPSDLACRVLYEITKSRETEFVLFFDGLDQMSENMVENAFQFLHQICQNEMQINVYLTARLWYKFKVEEILGNITYTICPLQKETQVIFLKNMWVQEESLLDIDKLTEFASYCLENFQNSLSENERNITGIPMHCKFIAEEYAEQASTYADLSHQVLIKLSQNFENSELEIYSKFLGYRFEKTNCKFACLQKSQQSEIECSTSCQVKSFHLWQALKLIFPGLAAKLSGQVTSFENLSLQSILLPSVLTQKGFGETLKLEFMYRSFAEFLVAEYFLQVHLSKPNNVLASDEYHKHFERLVVEEIFTLSDSGKFPMYTLNENRLACLLNAMLTGIDNSELQIYLKYARISSSSVEFLGGLVACLRHGYDALFDLIIRATINSDENILAYHKEFLEKNTDIVSKILEETAKSCNVQTVAKLCDFFNNYFNLDMGKLCSHPKYGMLPIKVAMGKADYELSLYLVKEIKNFEHRGLLYHCFENTYFDDDEQIQKKLDIAQYLTSKESGLLKESFNGQASPLLTSKIHINAIKFLVDSQIDINVCDKNQQTILNWAGHYMNYEDFIQLGKYILELSSRDWFLDDEKWKTFFLQLNYNDENYSIRNLVGILNFLFMEIDHAEEDTQCEFSSTELNTEEETLLETIKNRLLEPNFYLKFKDGFITLFRMSVLQNYSCLVNILISNDKSLLDLTFSNNQSVLHKATNVSVKMFSTLVAAGANIFAVDNNSETILHTAAKFRNPELFQGTVEILGKEWNSSVKTIGDNCTKNEKKRHPQNLVELFNWKECKNIRTPLHYVMKYLEWSDLCILKTFLSGGKQGDVPNLYYSKFISLDDSDLLGKTALHYALEKNNSLEVVQTLVEMGASWYAKSAFGCNVTHICAQYTLVEHLVYFVSLGCNVNETDSQGNTALQCSFNYLYEGQPVDRLRKTVNILISAGNNKLNKNLLGMTAHETAAKRNFPQEILNLLL